MKHIVKKNEDVAGARSIKDVDIVYYTRHAMYPDGICIGIGTSITKIPVPILMQIPINYTPYAHYQMALPILALPIPINMGIGYFIFHMNEVWDIQYKVWGMESAPFSIPHTPKRMN